MVVAINQVAVRMRECSDDVQFAATESTGCHFSCDKGLSPELFSASISFSPAEFPSMSPAAAAAGPSSCVSHLQQCANLTLSTPRLQ